MDKKEIHPPRWAEKFMSWYCKPSLLEDLQGDLNEYFQRNLRAKGTRQAKFIYIIDVFKFLRLYTIRKPELINLLINWIMIRSYIKTSGRSLVRNKLFSAINIVGLAISMSVGLLLIGMISDLKSYDKFHERHSTIYRVNSRYQFLDQESNELATTSMKAGQAIEETFSASKSTAILHSGFEGDLKIGEKIIPLSGFWANASLFDVFSFQLVQGNAATALKDPFSLILTEKSAQKLFGAEEPMGRIVILNNDKQYTVTGIVKDPPVFSHIRFDMLGSLSTREVLKIDKQEWDWDNIWSTWVYVVLPKGTDLAEFKSGLDKLSVKEDVTVKNTHVELVLQPMDDIMLGPDHSNSIGPVMGNKVLWSFSALTFVVILSACFNYTNLSIARSLKRTREVGIRKVIGAMKSSVIAQFVVESVIISLCALALAFGLFLLLRPYFINIQEDLQETLTLSLSPKMVGYFILFAVAVGVGAGLFPALFFSRISAVKVLKNISSTLVFKKLTLRKALIVFQYTISIIFISSTVIIYQQYKHLVSFDLGYNTENVLNIKLQGNKAEVLKKDLLELPEVKDISKSVMITSVGSYWGIQMKYINPDDSAGVYYNKVDEKYLPLHNHVLLAGQNFTAKPDSAAETEVIVNQKVLERFNIANQNPRDAIGEMVTVGGKQMQIIGVIKDFYYGKVDNNRVGQPEVIFLYSPTINELLNVKIESLDLIATYSKIESIWKKHDPIHSFEAKFYSDRLEESFSGIKAMVKVAGFLAFLIICIASMGLMGMVVFTTETRLKEISIRKVLGASETGLLYLLSKSFFFLLLVAALIAIPLTIVFFEQIAFPEINNHAPLSIPAMLLGVLAVFILAALMIASQTLKVARSNPADVLKNE